MKKITIITAILLISNLLSAQWIKQNQNYPDNHVLNDIFFIDQYNGWTVGAYGLHTDNSGLDWDWTWLHVYMDYGEKVFFTDANNGWVCGGQQICHTTDGGLGLESWVPQNINLSPQQYLNSIFFIDSLNGWAYGYYDNGITIGGDLFKTTDGGNNWEWQYNMLTLSDMYFLNESIGYCAGYNFQYTTDGGDSWNSAEINMWASSLDVIDENNFWIAGYDDNEKGIIKSSNDGGLTWNKKLGDTIQPLNDVTFIDSNNGWAVGDSGTILHTSDGGNNWEFQESGTIADLNSVFFVDENYGWICGDSSIILHTDNGGVSDHCLPEGITFTTQEQIDNFQTDYPGCTEIEGNVTIGKFGDVNISNLNGLNVLTSIHGFLEIYGTDLLSDFTGLDNLTYVGKHLGIGKLYTSGNTTMGTGNSISSIKGLENLTYVGDSIDIRYNIHLVDIDELSNLTIINGDFILKSNWKLSNLNGCTNIDTIGGSFIISDNDSLENFSGLESLRIIDGDFTVTHYINDNTGSGDSSNLKNMIGLNNLESIKGSVLIKNQNSLQNFYGLEKLTSVEGDFRVFENDSLESLNGIEQLNEISGEIQISGNGLLVDISTLSDIIPSSIQGLRIFDNVSLSNCDISSVCEYLIIDDYAQIYGNALGCENRNEVEEACASFIADTEGDHDISMYPNPVTSYAILSGEFGSCKTIHICLYNTTGICLKSWEFTNQQSGQQEFNLDVSNLPPGIYFLHLQAGNEVVTKKIVKL